MLVNRYTFLALCSVFFACHQDSLLDGRINIDKQVGPEQSNDADASTSKTVPVSDETITAPVPITGAYLACLPLPSDNPSYQQKVGCRVEFAGKVVTDFKQRVEKTHWGYKTEGSPVTIQQLNDESAQDWAALFGIQADPKAVESRVGFELSFAFSGGEAIFKTNVVLVWNDDCALPPIQFESIGELMGMGSTISDQFLASHGVRFSTLSGAPVLVAGYNQGAPSPLGYYGGPNSTPNYLAPGQNGGKYFITDGFKNAEATDTLVIDYTKPTKEASLDLIDVDFMETYVIRALNSDNQPIDELQVQAQTAGSRDGQTSRFVVRSPDGSNSIAKIQVYGFIPPGNVGIGFGLDNFSPRCVR